MILVEKNVGETPLERLDRLRVEEPHYRTAKLAYAGRLDPMAEGIMMVLVDDEVYQKDHYMAYDKEYVAEFLLGVATDTGDILGRVTSTSEQRSTKDDMVRTVEKIRTITTQTYPWFSAKAVKGKKLFDHYRSGNTVIDRPTKEVVVYRADMISFSDAHVDDIAQYVLSSIQKVSGDFRQQEILNDWDLVFQKREKAFQKLTLSFLVSSGTFIRALAEYFPISTTVLTLRRTQVLPKEK